MINVIDPESLLENTQVQELNGLVTTVVSAPYSKELEEAFYVGSRDVDDNNIFWLYKVDKRTNENSNLIIEGTYVLFDELKAYDLIRDKRPSNATALTGINAILEGCRWQVGNVASTHKGTANWYYVSRLEAFWEYLENWNVEFKPRMTFSQGKITGRYIDIVDKLSDDYGKWYEYGDKLLHITAEHASNSLYTAFIGRGKGEEVGDGYGRRIGFNDVVWSVGAGHPVDKPIGQDYVEIPQATELYGYSDGKPRTTVVTFEDTEDATLLLEQTYAYALDECRPKLQMKADVLETGLSELGETCTIIREDIGIRYKTRVFKITRNFLNKNQKTVEFGDEIVQSTAKRNSNIGKVIKKQEQQTINWLESLHLQLQDTYFNEDGYNYELKADNEYELPGGYYSFNAPIDQNPTKVIYLGAGMLAIANSKNLDGSWRFRTWGTGDGFTADLINVGTLKGINISGVNFTGVDMTLENKLNMIGNNSAILSEYNYGDQATGSFKPRWFQGEYSLGWRYLRFSNQVHELNADGSGPDPNKYLGYSEGFYGGNYFKQRTYNNSTDLTLQHRVDITSDLIQISSSWAEDTGIQLKHDGTSSFSNQMTVPSVRTNEIIHGVNSEGLTLNPEPTNRAGMWLGRDGVGTALRTWGVYDRTYSSAANLHITDTGTIGRSTSATKYKLNISEIQDIEKYALKVLELQPKQWFDKEAVETYSLECESKKQLTKDNLPITPFYGLIAEDLVDAGLEKYVQYGKTNEDGTKEVEGIMYDRLWTLLIPIVKEQREEIKMLKSELNQIKEHLGLL